MLATKAVKAIEVSDNAKTGPVSATYASQASCPNTCPFYRNGCYAELGPTGIHTRKISSCDVVDPVEIAKAEADAISDLTGRQDLRVHVVGDCSSNEAAFIVSSAMAEHRAKRGSRAWTYTHAWRDVERSSWQYESILASVETTDEIAEARSRGYAAAIVVDSFKSDKLYNLDGEKILPCPNQTKKIQCVDCGLCMKADFLHKNNISIGFEAHGVSKRKVLLSLEVKNNK